MLRGEDDASPLAAACRTLRFKAPKEADGMYVCHAVMPQSRRLQVKVDSAKVASVSSAGNKTRRVYLSLSKDQARQLMALDEFILSYVKDHLESWFDGNLDESLVDDYHRPIVVAEAGMGVCAKIVMASKSVSGGAATLEPGYHDATFQLIGVQFMKQQFCLVWRLATASPPSIEDEVSRAEEDNSRRYGFLSDSETDDNSEDGRKNEVDAEEEGAEYNAPSPSWEDYEAMRSSLLDKLREKLARRQEEVSRIQEAVEELVLADNQDIEALERGSVALDGGDFDESPPTFPEAERE
jgi:hypothetical protein